MYKDTLDNFGTGTVITKKIQLIPSYKKTDREYIVQFIDESTGAMIDMTSLLSVNSSSGFYLTPPQDKTSIAFRVKYGNTFDFVINLVEGYTNSIYNVVYYKSHLAEGEKVVENNVQPNMFGYSIEVFNDVSIKVKNVKLNTYTVTFKMPNGKTVEKQVEHGGSVELPKVDVGFMDIVWCDGDLNDIEEDRVIKIKRINTLIPTLIVIGVIIVIVIIGVIRKKRLKALINKEHRKIYDNMLEQSNGKIQNTNYWNNIYPNNNQNNNFDNNDKK